MFNLKVKCYKHPRYNPAVHFEAGIIGGCVRCSQLWELYKFARKLFWTEDPPPG